jgi:flagellar protein FliS
MAMTAQAMRARYAADSVGTASPARILTMLYDRLVRDLSLAEAAIATGDGQTAHNELVHAQAIIQELNASLDVDVWEGGTGLAQLYTFLHDELVGANVAKDAARVAASRQIIEPLRDAWHQAAQESQR